MPKFLKSFKFESYIIFGLIISLLICLHPLNLKVFSDFGNWQWWFIICAIFGLTLSIGFTTFLYVFLFKYTLRSLIQNLRDKNNGKLILIIFQFVLILGMTSPVISIIYLVLLKLYAD